MLYFNYNGKILVEKTPVIGADNRGIRYGDGLFETIKCINNNLVLFDEHLARLWSGLQLLQFQIPKLFTPDFLEKEIYALLKKNKLQTARVRLSIIRGDGGLFDNKNNIPIYIIQAWSLEPSSGLNVNGLTLSIYRDASKSLDKFSNSKHNNFLPYLMGALYAKQQYCNDAIILNSEGRISDTCMANIFLIKNNRIVTPPLHEGCIAGVMRRTIIKYLYEKQYDISEVPVNEEMISEAEEVFLTNSIYNIRWVGSIDHKTYTNLVTKKIYDEFVKTNPTLFC